MRRETIDDRGVPHTNTVAAPMLMRPIEYGADISVYSLSGFTRGRRTVMGEGIVHPNAGHRVER